MILIDSLGSHGVLGDTQGSQGSRGSPGDPQGPIFNRFAINLIRVLKEKMAVAAVEKQGSQRVTLEAEATVAAEAVVDVSPLPVAP